MITICKYGLFIGVDRYANLPKDGWLTHASTDASRLCAYFSRADPRGFWKAPMVRKSPSKRVDILTALTNWVKKIPSHHPGLFYFSGHGHVSKSGLILMSSDAHDHFPQDTGLPLSRVLEIFKEHAADGKRFFVVLDCCRNGIMGATTDNIPSNVCILYACEHDGLSYETLEGGVLTQSITESLEAIALETRSTTCSVRSLCNRLGRQLFAWRPSSALTYELYGNWADQFYLPIAPDSAHAGAEQRVGPSAVLRYWFGSEQDFNKGFQLLAGAIFQWYGISYKSAGGGNFVREHFEFPKSLSRHRDIVRGQELSNLVKDGGTIAHPPDNKDEPQAYFFQIRLPDGYTFWTSADFLEHLLNMALDIPQTLILTWPREVDFSIFKGFRHAVGGEWFGAGREGLSLAWKNIVNNGQYRGVAYVSLTERGKTQVSVSCETFDPLEMPLNYLMPSLRDVYDLFRFVRV